MTGPLSGNCATCRDHAANSSRKFRPNRASCSKYCAAAISSNRARRCRTTFVFSTYCARRATRFRLASRRRYPGPSEASAGRRPWLIQPPAGGRKCLARAGCALLGRVGAAQLWLESWRYFNPSRGAVNHYAILTSQRIRTFFQRVGPDFGEGGVIPVRAEQILHGGIERQGHGDGMN